MKKKIAIPLVTTAALMAGGRSVYVHTGDGTRGKQPNGTADSAQFYWNSGNYVWNNDKDTATLRSDSGRAYDSCKWTKPGKGSTAC